MQALVILAHPRPSSFAHAAAASAERALQHAGHEVATIDLYAQRYRAAMNAAERTAYHGEDPVLDPVVAAHIDLVRAAEILVFVYPTWWSGLPAIMKGWLERTMLPGVGFVFHPRTGRVRPGLTHVRHLVGISTYGSTRLYVRLINDNGRRTLMRALRMSTGLRTRRIWLALYGIDSATARQRDDFLAHIEHRLGRLT